ncbi:type III polyketide synthase [Streptomyces virginiae]|uniref:type III polyketide synthase n=1 Tax=Streptomyces virginiae TaxID=1961 RepID=UPI0036B7C73F
MPLDTDPLPQIAATSVAFPKFKYPQDEIAAAFARHGGLSSASVDRMVRLHKNSRVDTRYLAIPLEEYQSLDSLSRANDLYVEVGLELAERALNDALSAAALDASDVDLVVTTSSIGLAIPPLDAHLAQRLGFRSDIKRMPLFGLGCAGGAVGIARLHDYLRAYPDAVAVLLTLELNSLTVVPNRGTISFLVASGLFGDGVGAVVASGSNRPLAKPADRVKLVGSESRLYPDALHMTGARIGEDGFLMTIAPEIPKIVENNLGEAVTCFLKKHGLAIDDVATWVSHTGGPRVLEAIQRAVSVPDAALSHSWDSMREAGNVSGTSVVDVLHRTLSCTPARNAPGLILSSGPGFSCEMVLVEY